MIGLSSLFGSKKKVVRKTLDQYKQENLVNVGREQFKWLLKKNLRVPVVLL